MDKMRIALIGIIMMVIGSMGYAGTYEKEIYVDMTILWGGTLPEAVYILPDYNDDSGIQLQKWEDGTWKPLNNSGLYNNDNRNNGIEQNYSAGLKLTDDNFDGIYTGKVKYIGNDGKKVKTRLYIRKNDTFNTLHTPYYERKSGVNGEKTIDSEWRPIVGNGDAIKWSWEDKWLDIGKSIDYTSSHTIYKGLSSELGIINVGYTNADPLLRRDVSNNIEWSSSDSNIAYVEKTYANIGTTQYVKSVRIIGKNIGNATITIRFGLSGSTTNGNIGYQVSKTISVKVQDYNQIDSFQTVILNASNDITSNDIIRIDNNSSFYTGAVPMAATFAPNTRDAALANPYSFATTTYTSFATPVGGEGYTWWVPSVVRTGAIFNLTRWNSTGTTPKDLEVSIWKNKDSAKEIKSTLKIPAPVGGMSKNISRATKKFYWNENSNNYLDYTNRDVIVRISKVETSRTSIRYNLNEGLNPIVRADNVSIVDTAKMENFDKNTGLNYLDYVFNGANTLISVDGRMVKSDMYSSGERTITISKFPVGKYRIQLYTLRSNLNSSSVSGIRNYSVLTFEGEDIFEVTSRDYDEDNTVEADTYYINKINPYKFPTIQTYVMTRSKYLINPSTSSIFYNNNAGKVGERMEDSSATDGYSATGSAGSNITVTADTTYQSVKPQMDIVLCLDRSSSMGSSRMGVVKETWRKFEENMAKRGYDVKYQMVSFGGATKDSWWVEPNGGQVLHNSWVRSLQNNSGMSSPTSDENAYTNNDKFVTTSNEGGYEPSNQALYKAADILNNYGRTIGEKKSKRYIIFFTDEGGRDDIDVDHQEKYIRGSGVTLIGLGQVYINDAVTKAQMFDDDSGEAVSGGSGRYYYDLKILLGDVFNWYQITNDSDNMLKKLERGMVNAGYTTFWKIEHKTPYLLENYTKRSVEFEIRESTINGTVGTKAMKYGGIAEERVYRAPNLLIVGTIDTPKKNDAFQLNPSDKTKYIIKGKMWGELTFEDLSIPMAYADLSQIDLRIFEDKSINNPSNYDNANALIINGTDERVMSKTGIQLSKSTSDGSYSFEFNVEDKKLQSTGLESFFVKLTAKSSSSGMEGSIGQQNIKLDSDPPKLIDIKMVNTTVATAMGQMNASDSATNAFNMDITALNTLWYTPYSDATLASDTTKIKNPVLTNRIRKDNADVPYDGRFVKNGDNLTIKAVFIDQNFDEASSTPITAIFTGLENLPVTKTATVTTKSKTLTGGEKAVEITAEWNVTVANSSTADSVIKMNITATDKYGNKSSDSSKKNYVGDIEIARLDNVNPGYPEWDSTKLIGNTGGVALTSFASKKDSAIIPVITKDAYRINCYDGATTDTNGIRAFKVYYTYDDTKSDVSDPDLTKKTGNHDVDLPIADENTSIVDVHWFYIKAGDAVNLSGNTDILIPATGYGEKTPKSNPDEYEKPILKSNHGDDGKYIFKITAVDKAGNETMYSATKAAIESDGASRAVYVDTVAPRIARGQIYVEKYANSSNYSIANYYNIVKNGDKAYIHTVISDFSAVTDNTTDVFNLDSRYHNGGNYPKYSGLIGNGIGSENPVFTGVSVTTVKNVKNFVLKIGEVADGINPYMIISGKANQDYLAPIIIGAKDLAGNEFIDSGITCQVDNIKPTTPVIKAYAMESKYNPENHGVENFKELNGNDYTAQNVKDIDSKDNVTHFTKKMAYILRNLAVIDSDVTKAIIYSNGNQRSFDKDSYYTIDFYNHFGKNEVKMQLLDKAGNLSDESNIDEIVIDKSVPDGNPKYIFTSPKPAKKKGDKYTIDISITGLKDYTGLQKIQVMKLVKPVDPTKSDCEEVKPTGSELMNNAPATDLSGLRSISGTVDLEVPTSKIGTKVNLELYLYDNMGNKSEKITYVVLVPTTIDENPSNTADKKKGVVELKSIQKNSNKEIRTKIDVVTDTNKNINLKKTEETGKSAQ